MMRQSQWDSVLTPVIHHHFDLGMAQIPQMRSTLFNVQSSNLAQEKGTGIGGMSPDEWDMYRKEGKKGRLGNNQLYTQNYNHQEYAVELVIEKRLLINDQYGQIQKTIQRAGLSAAQKMEIDAASLFNNGFDTAYLFSDNKPLFSDSHPISPSDTSSTYDNNGTLPFTEANVSAVRILMMRFKDDKGNELGIVPDELWFPPELEDAAIKIARSGQLPGTANNDTNPQAGRWTLRPWQRLTDVNAWFMTSSAWRKQVANWYDREGLVVMLTHETTTELVYELKLHYSFGVDDWRFAYGNNPS